ncbi:hypothetical protein [Candidatus Nephthysia bennettiae]|uniref:Uncharacterized protein n=1 Tax=Candidatus Nephthysia bennettiae TaxID=3127016 RepID=A0A934K7B1_9BACT|nr:hypothetical protein [Candidatus Dormibacteraeota bacterium]MBJ7612646.1 hypothetical protein [Candidatus Dormibacteraeota bacterium]
MQVEASRQGYDRYSCEGGALPPQPVDSLTIAVVNVEDDKIRLALAKQGP